MADKKRAPLFGVGLFFGVLLGVFLTMAFGTSDTSETFDDYEKRMNKGRARPPADHGGGGGGAEDGHGGGGAGGDGHGGGGRDPRTQMAKIHFMKKFVKALTQMPENTHPAISYQALLKDGAKPVSCSDCHKDTSLDMNRMVKADPGPDDPTVRRMRGDLRVMVPLMQKWVERLNTWHGDRLKEKVTCKSCHAVNPAQKFQVYPALMNSFVMALKKKPTNKAPAKNWKPLLKNPKAESMLCAQCHGETGKQMEKFLDRLELSRPKDYADDRDFMVDIMEHWMTEANIKLKGLLVKPLACLDCHEQDPRR